MNDGEKKIKELTDEILDIHSEILMDIEDYENGTMLKGVCMDNCVANKKRVIKLEKEIDDIKIMLDF